MEFRSKMIKSVFSMVQLVDRFLGTVGIFLLLASPLASSSESIQKSISLTANSHSNSFQSQMKIDVLSDKKQEMVDLILQKDHQSTITEAYNAQLSKLIQSQKDEEESLQEQIDSIEETEQAMLPLLNIMLSQLMDFIEADLPFLLDERQKRLERLDSLLDRADVSVAEKYRQILDAYLIEVGYGRTIEAYSGTLQGANNAEQALSTHVNYLRIGRVALYYQSLHGQGGGLWLPTKSTWKPLNSDQNLIVTKAIQIAQQQRVPELLPLPVPSTSAH